MNPYPHINPSSSPPHTELDQSKTQAKPTTLRDQVESLLASVFGIIFISLAAVVTIETIVRKAFDTSMQGADELGGYALAIGSTIAFSLAVMGRAHIRVDVLHEKFGPRLQAQLNWLSSIGLALLATFLAWVACGVVSDTLNYKSTAATPWATPLILPQGLWLLCLLVFAAVSTVYATRATWLLLTGNVDALNHDFHPKSAKEELEEELDSLASRQSSEGEKS